MAFNEQLGDRIRTLLQKRKVAFEEKRMMGGLCFMVDDKMCVGIYKDQLMVRINPEESAALQERPGVQPMMMAAKKMNGFLFVDPAVLAQNKALDEWIGLCLDFNPLAKRSKKK